jgi:hypothetical protein
MKYRRPVFTPSPASRFDSTTPIDLTLFLWGNCFTSQSTSSLTDQMPGASLPYRPFSFFLEPFFNAVALALPQPAIDSTPVPMVSYLGVLVQPKLPSYLFVATNK